MYMATQILLRTSFIAGSFEYVLDCVCVVFLIEFIAKVQVLIMLNLLDLTS
jgi:hypothetical protein